MTNFETIRSKFPVTNNLIYLDHAAVAPIHSDAKKAVEEYLQYFLNFGIKNYSIWAEKIESIRKNFASFINAEADEVAFVKNTSAGLSIFANGLNLKEGDNIVIPDIEFPANIYPWMNLNNKGIKVKFLKTKNGCIDLQDLENSIDKNTKVVTISWIEYGSGFKNDLDAVSAICKKKSIEYNRKIYFCVDAIQGLGAFKLDVKNTEIDFLSADGHKWLIALEGAGILYCNKNIIDDIHPVSVGWKSVENPLDFGNIHFDLQKSAAKFEEGSMNVAGIISIGASLDLINKVGIENIESKILELTSFAAEKLVSKNINVISSREKSYRSGILCFETDDIERDYKKLLQNNIQLSKRGDVLRISPHFYNTTEEIEKFVEVLCDK